MLFKKLLTLVFLLTFTFNSFANTPTSTGIFKNWESFTAEIEGKKICFAQTIPSKRAPDTITREQSKLFVTFRPSENIKDEVSLTSGHDYKASTVIASSGSANYSFFSEKNFAWILNDQEEKQFIDVMKKSTTIIVKAKTLQNAEIADYYSMMGFTKAYNEAKKNCT